MTCGGWPLHLFTDESIGRFQETIRGLFLGTQDRMLTKRYLELFIQRIVVDLPSIEITGRVEAVLALMQKKMAVDDVPTADDIWLPGLDRCKNYVTRLKLVVFTAHMYKRPTCPLW